MLKLRWMKKSKNGFRTQYGPNKTYKIGETYSVKGLIEACNKGFHCPKQTIKCIMAFGEEAVYGQALVLVDVSGDEDKENDYYGNGFYTKTAHRTMRLVREATAMDILTFVKTKTLAE